MMKQHYGKSVILLIDEYDVPVAKANSNGYYKEMLDVMKSMEYVVLDWVLDESAGTGLQWRTARGCCSFDDPERGD